MADAKAKRVNCLSRAGCRLVSKHGAPAWATAGKVKDKKPDMGETTAETMAKNTTTKVDFFHASPKKTRIHAIKTKRAVTDKKPGRSLCKERVVTRPGTSRKQNSNNAKPKNIKETFKQIKVYEPSVSNQSDSPKRSEQIRSTADKSGSGVTPPRQSKKRMSVATQAVYLKFPHEHMNRNLAIKRRTCFHPASPSRVVKTQSCQNCYFISFSVSPQKFVKSNDMATVPRLEEERLPSLPHKCVGYENLFNTDNRIQGVESPKYKFHKSRCKSRDKLKVRGCEEMSRHGHLSKHSLDKLGEGESIKEIGAEVPSQLRESQLVGSKLCIRSFPCKAHSIQNIFHNSALVFLRSDKQSQMAHADSKTTTAKPKIKLFSRNVIERNKQVSDFQHFIYTEKLPSFNYYTSLQPEKSNNSPFTVSSLQVTSVQKPNKDKNAIRNALTTRIQRSAVVRNKLPPERPTADSPVQVKLVYKKTKSSSIQPQQRKTVKNRDKSKLTVTNADTKKAIKDLPSARQILMKRPQTTIRHYRNREKGGEPDICSISDIKSHKREISKYIPEISNPEMAFCSVQNAFGEKPPWASYDSSQERVTSFLRHVATCDGSARRDQLTLLNGPFRVPVGAMSCSEQRGGIFHGESWGHSEICIPTITDHPTTQRSRSSCCAVTFMPSLFSFLNSINKTLSAPILHKKSENAIPCPKGFKEIQPGDCAMRRLQLTSDDKLSTIEDDSVSRKGSKCTKHETDGEQACADETLQEVEDLPVGDENTADTLSELKTSQVNDRGCNLTLSQTPERGAAAQKHTRQKQTTPLSISVTKAAKAILRTGNIDMKKVQQSGKRRIIKPPSKDNSLEKKHSNCPKEESEMKHKDSAFVVKWDIQSKLLVLGIICFTTIVHVALYYLIPRM